MLAQKMDIKNKWMNLHSLQLRTVFPKMFQEFLQTTLFLIIPKNYILTFKMAICCSKGCTD
uniref:Uncharacterized protein n=1 Tax=Octopus bimaculoides TaxID=37653 RepID=A0A0L8G6M2_OCTBM